MVGRNYDMCASGPSDSAPDRGAGDLIETIETIETDFLSSSRRGLSEAVGTVLHGRFQYLGDRPFEATDSLRAYTRVSEFQFLLYDLLRRSLDSCFIWCGRVMSNLANHLMHFD